MLRFSLLAVAGAAACLLLPGLPASPLLWAGLVVALVLCAVPAARPVAACIAGACYAGLVAGGVLADRLPVHRSGEDFKFVAQIVEFPKEQPGRFTVVVAPDQASGLPQRLRISGYDQPQLPRLGETWCFEARLKRPRGSRNPGGFDFAGWLHRERIGATGYVRSAGKCGDARPGLAGLRRHIVERIELLLPAGEARAALLAITAGTRHRIERESWQRYAVTGTSHLMAISGLHVGLAAGSSGLLAWALFAICRPGRNHRDNATAFALIAAAAYAVLSGFAVPSQRALLMTVAAGLYLRRRRPLAALPVLGCVALLVVIAEPLSLLQPGFWLSFAAVGCLLLLAQDRPLHGGPGTALAAVTRLQFALFAGLLPLTAALFARLAWVAPIANLLAIPVFSVLIVPCALLGMVLDGPFAIAGDGLLWLAWYSLDAMHVFLGLLAKLPAADTQLATPSGWGRLLLALPALWILLPRDFPGRNLAWLGVLGLVCYRAPLPSAGCAELHVLDVGQGLAAVVRTRQHSLLYDTGPAWRGGANSGALTIVPFLHSLGLSKLDRIIVSHADQDHAGGLAAVTGALPTGMIMAGEPLPVPGIPCFAGQNWRWDDVEFRVLYPPASRVRHGNNASCVVEVSAGGQKLLLSGDIEAAGERELGRNNSVAPAAVVLVPHHGSRTSSTPEFVHALQPAYAVVSAGFGNRWGFPKADIVSRWQHVGATVLNTATSGALQFRLCAGREVQLVRQFRFAARRYWHD